MAWEWRERVVANALFLVILARIACVCVCVCREMLKRCVEMHALGGRKVCVCMEVSE